jgi:hypothetical protein
MSSPARSPKHVSLFRGVSISSYDVKHLFQPMGFKPDSRRFGTQGVKGSACCCARASRRRRPRASRRAAAAAARSGGDRSARKGGRQGGPGRPRVFLEPDWRRGEDFAAARQKHAGVAAQPRARRAKLIQQGAKTWTSEVRKHNSECKAHLTLGRGPSQGPGYIMGRILPM